MGYMGLLLGACIYLLRVDFSMAMVCMVKPTDTAIRNDTNTTSRIYMYNKDERLLDGNITTISDPQESTDCLIDIQAADIAQQVGTKITHIGKGSIVNEINICLNTLYDIPLR